MQTIPWDKIKALEDEIKALKSLGDKPAAKKKVLKAKKDPLKGILKDALKGIKVTEKDFEDVKYKFDMDHILYQKHNQ